MTTKKMKLNELVPLVEKPELLRVTTIKKKFVDQMPKIEDSAELHNKNFQVVGMVEGYLIVIKIRTITDEGIIVKYHKMHYMKLVEHIRQNKKDLLIGDLMESILDQTPQIFKT